MQRSARIADVKTTKLPDLEITVQAALSKYVRRQVKEKNAAQDTHVFIRFQSVVF